MVMKMGALLQTNMLPVFLLDARARNVSFISGLLLLQQCRNWSGAQGCLYVWGRWTLRRLGKLIVYGLSKFDKHSELQRETPM